MRVTEIWRFPVKSLQGERLDRAELLPEGVRGDRRFAIFDVETGMGLTARRLPELLQASARTLDDGSVEITLPDGSVAPDDAALCAWLGRAVTLRSAVEPGPRRFENVNDFEHESSSTWRTFDGATTSFRDTEQAAVSIISTGSLGAWPQRRFRSNLVVDGSGENDLVGYRVGVGTAFLTVTVLMGRCVMVTRAQPGGIGRDLDVLRTIHRERDHTIAVGASVDSPGAVSVGDEFVF
jgi:uncharacterized protein YcbX